MALSIFVIELKGLAFSVSTTDQNIMPDGELAARKQTLSSVNFSSAKRFIYASFGVISLTLGIIGIAVPLLPTTPFLLLSAFLFSKSSHALHSWLLGHKYLGPPIADWEENRVIRPKAKILALSMLLLGISVLWFKFGMSNLWATVPSSLCMLGSGIFIITRNSTPQTKSPANRVQS